MDSGAGSCESTRNKLMGELCSTSWSLWKFLNGNYAQVLSNCLSLMDKGKRGSSNSVVSKLRLESYLTY